VPAVRGMRSCAAPGCVRVDECIAMSDGWTKEQTEEFIENSRHAIEHLYDALDKYRSAYIRAKQTVEEIERSKQMLSDTFMYRDQWSPDANHYHAQYMENMKYLNKEQQEAKKDFDQRLKNALACVGATEESMSCLAGAVLQISRQVLSIRYSGKPTIDGARRIGSQSIVDVIWEGRNHAIHWDEGEPKQKVKDMLNALSTDIRVSIDLGKNNGPAILRALGWGSSDAMIADLKKLIK